MPSKLTGVALLTKKWSDSKHAGTQAASVQCVLHEFLAVPTEVAQQNRAIHECF